MLNHIIERAEAKSQFPESRTITWLRGCWIMLFPKMNVFQLLLYTDATNFLGNNFSNLPPAKFCDLQRELMCTIPTSVYFLHRSDCKISLFELCFTVLNWQYFFYLKVWQRLTVKEDFGLYQAFLGFRQLHPKDTSLWQIRHVLDKQYFVLLFALKTLKRK